MPKFYYDCNKCKHQYERENGTKGCNVIDGSKGLHYPIIAITRTKNTREECCICTEYDQRIKEVVPYRTAVKKAIWSQTIRRCSNCQNLVYFDKKVCPHCQAVFVEVENG